ncbi:hypothetical protein P692DRAFT_20750390 [Suillus brevipes Sb2]|nr:hypothetical protein P692DRAFT_20750390 [Suillus brevipes Sb2]
MHERTRSVLRETTVHHQTTIRTRNIADTWSFQRLFVRPEHALANLQIYQTLEAWSGWECEDFLPGVSFVSILTWSRVF